MTTTSTPVSGATNPYAQREELVTFLIGALKENLLNGDLPSLDFIADQLDGRDDSTVREWLKKHHDDYVPKDFDRALRNSRIRKDLGAVPGNAVQLVDIVVKRDKMNCLYNGQITLDKVFTYQGEVVPKENLQQEDVAEMAHFLCPTKTTTVDFTRDLRMVCDKHKLAITREAINDAVEDWHTKTRADRRWDLFTNLRDLIPPKRHQAEQTWYEVANKLFVTSPEVPAGFVVAVLKKFIQQVKRKLRGLPVYDHLMPVILGTQGKGKSTFVRAMLKPVNELVLNVDFKMIEDDRNIEIWKSYVLFLDEMGFASKANIDTIKNAITAETLTRKPLYTNSKVEIEQNATFIGCSNKPLPMLIKDPTGIRRFVALSYSNEPDWEFLNQIDWKMMWQSVDLNGDPMTGFKDLLRNVQEESRDLGRVEHWMKDFNPNAAPDFSMDRSGRVKAKTLYELFKNFEDRYYPGNLKTSLTEWGYEMRRLEESGMNTRFKSLGKKGSYVMYAFVG